MAGNPNWKTLSIQIPGQDALEKSRQALEAVVVYLEILKTILETVKVFVVDVGNPIKPIAEALLQIVLDMFESLRRTGVYAWWDVPNPLVDPKFNRFVGGFPAFVTRFKVGLRDPRDPNRPQPIPGVTKSGFTMIVADAEDPMALLKYVEVLTRFFSREFTKPRFPPPANVRVLPVGKAGDPILALDKFLRDQPKALAVEWSLPHLEPPGDPGFGDLIQGLSQTFMPPKFLIERSEVNPVLGEVDADGLGDPKLTGPVVLKEASVFRDRATGPFVMRKFQVSDEWGDPFFKFTRYTVIDIENAPTTFLLGQLGTFRFIDTDVKADTVYYYRVRAFSGTLNTQEDGSLKISADQINVIDKGTYLQWPGDGLVMGLASPITPAVIPTFPERFDVYDNLKRLFLVAFSLNFHQPPPDGVKFDSNSGMPIGSDPEKHYTDIGKGALQHDAGSLTWFEAVPLIGKATSDTVAVTEVLQPDPASKKNPREPWNEFIVSWNAARLATIVSRAMLFAQGATGFKALMEGPFIKGSPTTERLGNSIGSMVYELTKFDDPDNAGIATLQYAASLYSNAFKDPYVRLNVLAAVEYVKGFTLSGKSANWIQVSMLRDIVPWSGQLIYEILAKMQALLDAYKGALGELNAFIDLLEQKVDTLERFLQYLTSILDFIQGLSLGFYVLSVKETDGDINEWSSLIDNAGGTKPTSGPGGYSAGVVFAYVAPDVSSFVKAFEMF